MDSENLMLIPAEFRICQECLQYLSVGPVKIRPNGEVICGRCVPKFENEEVLVKSLFNTVAQKMLFPCIHHFYGCDCLVSLKDASKHEVEHATATANDCIFCSFKGNFCQLNNHFKFCHADKMIQNCTFEIKLEPDFEDALIMCERSNILLVKISLKDSSIYITPSSVNHLLDDKDIALKFCARYSAYLEYKLTVGEEFEIESNTLLLYFGDIDNIAIEIILDEHEKKQCQDIRVKLQRQYFALQKKLCELAQREIYITKEAQNLQLEKENFAEAISVGENNLKMQKEAMEAECSTIEMDNMFLKEIYKKLSVSLFTCVFCNSTITGKTIFFCPKNHAACDKCVTSNCKICDNICQWSEFNELGKIKVICDWANCPEIIPILEYLSHKQCCKFRRYKCPLKNCSFVGPSADFINHWHCKIPPLVVDSDTLEIPIKDKQQFEAYWIYKSEFYHILFKSNTVIIHFLDILLPNNFEIRLDYGSSWTEEASTMIAEKQNKAEIKLIESSTYQRRLKIIDKNES